MTPYFLRFASRAEAEAVGATWMERDKDGNVVMHLDTEGWSYHVVGDLYTRTVPPVKKAGYHVNVLTASPAIPDGLLPYVVDPVTPDSIFAGMPAVRPVNGWGSLK